METIHPHYEINEQTMAIMPANHMNYHAIVIETDRTIYIRKTPFEIIERGCLDNFSSFDGRRDSIKHLTGYTRKVPIPISIYRNIFAFPTHALKDWVCGWIFYEHVGSIVEENRLKQQSVVIFRNGSQITVDVPRLVLVKQLERTGMIRSLVRRNS